MPKTQHEIDATAARLRADGLPDSLNRWLGMTPEVLAESEAKVAREVDRQRRSTTMPKAVGPKEQALRDLKSGSAPQKKEADVATTKKKAAPAAKKGATNTDKTKKAAKKVARAQARTPVREKAGSAIRPNSKMAIVHGLLTRSGGCTAKEVMEACEWPSVSMPQQAKAAGLTLAKEKDGSVTRYRAA